MLLYLDSVLLTVLEFVRKLAAGYDVTTFRMSEFSFHNFLPYPTIDFASDAFTGFCT